MAKQKLTFEESLTKLEEIVSAIEQGDVPLEQSIEKYAEGIKLIKQCRTILDAAESKVQLLSQGAGDQLVVDGELADDEDAAEDNA
ncbi:MAG: exodeoxyribonuclease VII small subunit [Planctomycetota bacterium]|jgi:exodeoxyribonuclease VII small subunit